MRAGALRSLQPARSERHRGRQMDCRPSQADEPKGEVMRGDLLLVLMLATGVAAQTDKQPDKKPVPEHAATAAKTHKKAAAGAQKQEAQAKTKAPQEGTAEAQAESKKAQGQGEAAQAKTEAGQTEEPQAETEEPQADKEPKVTSVPGAKALGMSVLGNQEAPTSL